MCSVPDELEKLTENELIESLNFANRFCALSVQKKGAIASYPTLDEMQKINY
jgi:fructokinase